jgi:hypothetical protein
MNVLWPRLLGWGPLPAGSQSMPDPFIRIWNKHAGSCGEPPIISNQANNQYIGYFQNRHGEQWVFVYDRERNVGELRLLVLKREKP